MIAAGFWLLLSLDRAVLQSHRRYASLGLSLIVEIGVRTVLVLTFAELGWGIWGYASGLLIGEVVATAQARVVARQAWGYAVQAALPADQSSHLRALSVDLAAALTGFALLGVLQNADIILVGRLHHSQRRVLCRHLGGVQGAGLRGHPARELHPPRSVDPLAPGRPRAAPAGGDPRLPSRSRRCCCSSSRSPSPNSSSPCSSGASRRGAPAFATLVGAMACLGATVVLTNYLLGAARRWVVAFLGLGMVCLLLLIQGARRDHGHGAGGAAWCRGPWPSPSWSPS